MPYIGRGNGKLCYTHDFETTRETKFIKNVKTGKKSVRKRKKSISMVWRSLRKDLRGGLYLLLYLFLLQFVFKIDVATLRIIFFCCHLVKVQVIFFIIYRIVCF